MRSAWESYTPEPSADDIPMERWGKDHWTTLAYLETRAVDGKGKIENKRMRCNARLHRAFCGVFMGRVIDGSKYPTRLNDGTTVEEHDDWSCLEDMVVAGVLTARFRQVNMQVFGNSEAAIKLTPLGASIAAQLRAHKAAGGSYAGFAPTVSSLRRLVAGKGGE